MSDSYANASDNLAAAIGKVQGKSSGYHNDIGHMTLDHQLKVAEIQALLAVAEELSALNPAKNPDVAQSTYFRLPRE